MNHEHYMDRCLQLAKLGIGKVAPNPMVGSVVVHENKIIGEGYHEIYGGPHAEVNAIRNVDDESKLKDSTIYVNLEPCAHFGKTPPCSDLIIEKGIPRVVIGCIDSYSEVAGKGVEKMRSAGIEVIEGVRENESLFLNRRFFTFHNKKRPYVILKWAQTKDGLIDIDRQNNQTGIAWITQPETKQLVHKWRAEESGILVGKNTVINDNPELTVREAEGSSPTRFVIDPKMELNLSQFKIGSGVPTIQITSSKNDIPIEDILTRILEENIQSIIIEGGKTTLEGFIKEGLWDEARVITGNVEFNIGQRAPILNAKESFSYYYGKDLISVYYNA